MKKLAVWKKLLIVLGSLVAVVAIVAASVYGTVAYLTASSKVSNVFTVGNVYIEMYESKVTSDGKIDTVATPAGTKKNSDGNSYHLVPGNSYDKDPTVYVQANSEAAYLFLLVRNDIRNIEVKDDTNKPTMKAQMEANGWREYGYAKPSTGTYAWVYYGYKTDENGQYLDENNAVTTDLSKRVLNDVPVGVKGGTTGAAVDTFSNFYIASDADVSLYGGAGVTLTAIGIQSSSFDNVDRAWDAVVETYPFIYDIEHNNSSQPGTGSTT